MAVFGLAIWCAATLLGWAAETAEMDISGSLAVALLAIVAILPEYAVDVLLAFKAGEQPEYEALASANMNGATRLLIGFALPLTVLVGLTAHRRRLKREGSPAARPAFLDAVPIPAAQYSTMFFLVIAAGLALVIPASRQVHAGLGGLLLLVFVVFLWHTSRGAVEEPDLVGVSAYMGSLSKNPRRWLVISMFLIAAATIAVGAEPFVEALKESGHILGIDERLLIQWLAPLASEAPEFIIALTLASRRKTWAAVGMILTSMVNQWTALVGSLPMAYRLGGGSWSLPLDSIQVEEFLLTASVTAVAVALLLRLRVPAWGCWFMLAVFAAEFIIQDERTRLLLAAVNVLAALVLLVRHRHSVPALFKEPFRRQDHS
jgi:cation:H+ antiporter